MKILVIGAGGMIGHKMFQVLKQHGHQLYGSVRQPKSHYEKFGLFKAEELFDSIDVLDHTRLAELFSQLKPDVILNCVGITLRKSEINDEEYSRKVNTELPHFLSSWVEKNGSYLVHFSTDCVFSGKGGPYSESSEPSATDIYGRTKAAGEVTGANALTLRGSMIGRELFGKTELLEWALSQRGRIVKGFSKVIYSGVTTNVMAELVAKLLVLPTKPTGLYQVSSAPISKYELLNLINKAFDLKLTILEDFSYASSKILLSEKLKKNIGFNCPSWPEMVDELAKDLFNYNS